MDTITVNDKTIEPNEYFKILKDNIKGVDTDMLESHLTLIGQQLIKAKEIGQTSLVDRLAMTYDVICREQMILAAGFSKFVYQEDIMQFIDVTKVVKIIDLERFPRAIPDECLSMIKKAKELHTLEKEIKKEKQKQPDPTNKKKTIQVEVETEIEVKKPLFDKFCVVFTDLTNQDHTTEEEKKFVERNRDPIVFGYFKNKKSGLLHDRFYFITDWEDKYCDLTFGKMIAKMSEAGIAHAEHAIDTDHTYIQELVRSTLKDMNDKSGFVISGGFDTSTYVTMVSSEKPEKSNDSFFDRLKSWLKD